VVVKPTADGIETIGRIQHLSADVFRDSQMQTRALDPKPCNLMFDYPFRVHINRPAARPILPHPRLGEPHQQFQTLRVVPASVRDRLTVG
jgi:hypothetical protein